MNSAYEETIIQKLIQFGESHEEIRAMVLSSSLCNPNAPADILSDFDVELFFEDPTPFVETDEWIDTLGLGPIMALWHWPNPWDHEEGDGRSWMRMVYLQDGTKMDISLTYLDDLRKHAGTLHDEYDIGYRVLLDKDGVTASMKPPTYKAYILNPPSEAQYISRIESFWMDSTYVAKFLWRDDILAVKYMLQEMGDHMVRQMLEWSVAMEHNWNWKPGKLGRGLTKALSPDICKELLDSFAGGDINDLWESLFKTTALYRRTAIKVGERLGYNYLYDLDKRVTTFHQTIRNLDRQTGTREELAQMLMESYQKI